MLEYPAANSVKPVPSSNEVPNNALDIRIDEYRCFVSVDKRPAAIVINVEDTEIHSIVGIGICRVKNPTSNATDSSIGEAERVSNLIQEHMPISPELIVPVELLLLKEEHVV